MIVVGIEVDGLVDLGVSLVALAPEKIGTGKGIERQIMEGLKKDDFPTSNCSGRKSGLFKPFHEMVELRWVVET